MIVGSTRDDAESVLGECRGQGARVDHYLLLVYAEFGLCCFLQANGYRRDDVLERTALNARERDPVEIFGVFFAAQNQAAARPAQCLVGGGGNEIRVRHSARMNPPRPEAGDM